MAVKTVLEKATVIEGDGIDENGQFPFEMGIGKDSIFLDEFRVVEQFPVSSGEADVYKVEKVKTGENFVLKFYRIGISPKIEVLDKIEALKSYGIVGLERYGVYKSGKIERFYEIQEFILHGSLAEYMAKNRLSKDDIKRVLSSINKTLFHCHANGIVHRDLKTANILLRELKPLMPVLTDFGIASVLAGDISRRLTNKSRTVDYAAPEALSGVIGKEADYWSLGIILMELFTGKHPFENISHGLINLYLTSKPMPIPENLEEEWQCLFKGLLTRDFKGRWGYEQVRSWLDGKYKDIPFYYEGETITTVKGFAAKNSDIRPYRFNDKEIYSVETLTEELIKDHENATKHLLRGYIGKWVENQIQDYQLKNEIDDILENPNISDVRKLSMFIYKANPSLPLTYQDRVFTEHNMALWLRNIIAGNETKLDKEILNDLIQGGLYANFLLETRRMPQDEVKRFKQTLQYGLENICNAAPFPLIHSAYLFLLLINKDAKKEALNSVSGRVCETVSKVLNGIYEESDKWIEPLREPNLLIVLFVKYGEEKTQEIISKVKSSASKAVCSSKNQSDYKELGFRVNLLEWFLNSIDESGNKDVSKIIGRKIETIKRYCSDTLSNYVLSDKKIYKQIKQLLESGIASLNNFQAGVKLRWLLKGLLQSKSLIIKRDDLKAQLETLFYKLNEILKIDVIDCLANKDYQTKIFSQIQRYVPRQTGKLGSKDLDWLQEATKRLEIPQPEEFITKTRFADMLPESIRGLKSVINEYLPLGKETEHIFTEAKTLLGKKPVALNAVAFEWNKRACGLYSRAKRFIITNVRADKLPSWAKNFIIAKKTLQENIKTNQLKLKSLIAEYIPKNEQGKKVFNKAKVLLKSCVFKTIDNLDNSDLEWNKAASSIDPGWSFCIKKERLLEDIIKKAKFLKEFSRNRRLKAGSDKALRYLISKSKKLAKKFSVYTLEEVNDKQFSYYSELYDAYERVTKNKDQFWVMTEKERYNLKFLRIFSMILGVIVFILIVRDLGLIERKFMDSLGYIPDLIRTIGELSGDYGLIIEFVVALPLAILISVMALLFIILCIASPFFIIVFPIIAGLTVFWLSYRFSTFLFLKK